MSHKKVTLLLLSIFAQSTVHGMDLPTLTPTTASSATTSAQKDTKHRSTPMKLSSTVASKETKEKLEKKCTQTPVITTLQNTVCIAVGKLSRYKQNLNTKNTDKANLYKKTVDILEQLSSKFDSIIPQKCIDQLEKNREKLGDSVEELYNRFAEFLEESSDTLLENVKKQFDTVFIAINTYYQNLATNLKTSEKQLKASQLKYQNDRDTFKNKKRNIINVFTIQEETRQQIEEELLCSEKQLIVNDIHITFSTFAKEKSLDNLVRRLKRSIPTIVLSKQAKAYEEIILGLKTFQFIHANITEEERKQTLKLLFKKIITFANTCVDNFDDLVTLR